MEGLDNTKQPVLSWLSHLRNGWIFVIFWMATCALYIATTRVGWVIDASGFLYNMKHLSFWDFINRTNSADQSFYQLLMLHYWVFYKLWGLNPWMWGILYITLHALNAWLAFLLCSNIFRDSNIVNGRIIAFAGAVLFIVSPYVSEVVVCRAYYHYLQAFLLILLVMLCAQKYMQSQRVSYAAGALISFVLAIFTLEIFYITPFLVLAVALYYRYAIGINKKVFYKTVAYFSLAQVVLLAVYFAALVVKFKHLTPHKIQIDQSAVGYLSKLPKYFFHLVLFGRFFSKEVKDQVYAVCESWPAIVIFYGLLVFAVAGIATRFKTFTMSGKALGLFFVLSLIFIGFLLPLPFPGSALLVFYDRYIYFADVFAYTTLALLAWKLVKNKYVLIGLFCIYVDVSLFFTIVVNGYWIESDNINNKLVRGLPPLGDKTVLLLNNPENMNGAPMIGSEPDGEFKHIMEVYTGVSVPNMMYDVASYNMVASYNGAHVNVINDSVINVALNHGGTWWWYDGHGAKSYETPDYKVDFKTKGLLYQLTLKHPASNYMLLYSVGDQWKTVDMSIRNKQQD